MKILIVEDDTNRRYFFRQLFANDDLAITDDVALAKAKLAVETFDLIMLDHDLGDVVYDNSHENSGYAVACFIERTNIRTPVIIHTQNPVGAERIYKTVPCGFKIPFPYIENEVMSLDATPFFEPLICAIRQNLALSGSN